MLATAAPWLLHNTSLHHLQAWQGGQLSEDWGPAELGGQRLQVSQVPEGVSGDLRRRMDMASLIARLRMQQGKGEKSHSLLRAGKTITSHASEAREIYGSDGVGAAPSGSGVKKSRNQLHVPILLVKSSGRGETKWISCSPSQLHGDQGRTLGRGSLSTGRAALPLFLTFSKSTTEEALSVVVRTVIPPLRGWRPEEGVQGQTQPHKELVGDIISNTQRERK